MARLFISHAAEDKEAIVAAVAKNLTADHEVWYDDYVLKAGHSLREQIDKGLRECDFGIVVLSKNYFGKTWTNNELDGLFALESSHRKIIICIWWKVGKSDVADYSPMLAGRVGITAKTSKQIADEIRASIVSVIRAFEIARDARGRNALIAVVTETERNKTEQRLLRCEAGAAEVRKSFVRINEGIKESFDAAAPVGGTPQFQVDHSPENLQAYAGNRLGVTVVRK